MERAVESVELKTCPFCGHSAYLVQANDGLFYVECLSCGGRTDLSSIEALLDDKNTGALRDDGHRLN